MVDRVVGKNSVLERDIPIPTIDQLPPPGYEEARAKEQKKLSEETGIPVDEIQRLEDMSEEEAAK